METRYKEYGYTITTDPSFQDKEFGITPQLQEKFVTLHNKIWDTNNNKVIDEITDLIIKHPLTPILKNFLSVAYSVRGNNKKAQEVNEWILKEHPNYLFGIINKVNALIDAEMFEEAEACLGKKIEIKELYPNRNLFHLVEISSYYLVTIRYLCAIGDIELAENRLEVLTEINPEGSEVEKAEDYLTTARLLKGFEASKAIGELEITPSFFGKKLPEQTAEAPIFNHPEIQWLYEYDLAISEDKIDTILALPRVTLIQDLETVLKDCINRHEYFISSELGREKTTMALHAIFFLTELKASESLKAITHFLSYDEEFLDYWLGDFITEEIWSCFYFLGKEQQDLIKDFLVQPNTYTYCKTAATTALEQMAIYYPEMENELHHTFKEVYAKFEAATIADDLIDSSFLGSSMSDAFDCNFKDLLPTIQLLFNKGYISEDVCGDYDELIQNYENKADYKFKQKDIKNLKELYTEVCTIWYSNQDDNKFDMFDDYELIKETPLLPIRTEPKTGRNDPCPCGSGKKYKKCCLKD